MRPSDWHDLAWLLVVAAVLLTFVTFGLAAFGWVGAALVTAWVTVAAGVGIAVCVGLSLKK